jgi:hypothetical protein
MATPRRVFRKNIGSDGNKWAAAAVPLLTRRPWTESETSRVQPARDREAARQGQACRGEIRRLSHVSSPLFRV